MTEGNVKQEQTEYEDLRAANIRRNEEIMRALGLDHTDFELHEAHKKKTSLDKSASGKSEQKSKKRKDNSQEDLEQEVGGVRRSARKLGMKAEISDTLPTLPDEEGASHRDARKLKDLSASQTEHENAERKQRPATIVGTASYQHTLHRVRTMSEKALAMRIKAIERAKGQFAVIKMRLFARVLCLEGMEELAEEATAAYRRLAEKLGEPDAEGGEDDEAGE